MIVCKFGGSSLADAEQIKKVIHIIKSNADRRMIVVSAPGKRHANDYKITDALYAWHQHRRTNSDLADIGLEQVRARFQEIIDGLGITFDLGPDIAQIKETPLHDRNSLTFVVSRGEYIMACILAKALDVPVLDAWKCIQINEKDPGNSRTFINPNLHAAVIPGFYGSTPDGRLVTFPRGGSDITGALVAAGVKAGSYENWTDVPGICMTDPRVVPGAPTIPYMTYAELRELAYRGAHVFHEEAMFPVWNAGIPTHIRNTNDPDGQGTIILDHHDRLKVPTTITGIAGRMDFTVITVNKVRGGKHAGFIPRLVAVFEAQGVPIEHMTTSMDTVSIVIEKEHEFKILRLLSSLRATEELGADEIRAHPDKMALIAVVGRGMIHVPGTAARILGALARVRINVRMIDQGSSELNIIIGIKNDKEEVDKAIRAIYSAFMVHERVAESSRTCPEAVL